MSYYTHYKMTGLVCCLLLLVGVAFFSSCRLAQSQSALSNLSHSQLIGHKWVLDRISPTGDEVFSPRLSRPVYLRVENQRISGNAGCNNFSATAQWKDDKVVGLSEFSMTRMACPDAELSLEADVMNILSHIKNYKVKENELAIYGPNNSFMVYLR